MQLVRVGLSLHQKTDMLMPNTTSQPIVHRRWLSPCHKFQGEHWIFCQKNMHIKPISFWIYFQEHLIMWNIVIISIFHVSFYSFCDIGGIYVFLKSFQMHIFMRWHLKKSYLTNFPYGTTAKSCQFSICPYTIVELALVLYFSAPFDHVYKIKKIFLLQNCSFSTYELENNHAGSLLFQSIIFEMHKFIYFTSGHLYAL